MPADAGSTKSADSNLDSSADRRLRRPAALESRGIAGALGLCGGDRGAAWGWCSGTGRTASAVLGRLVRPCLDKHLANRIGLIWLARRCRVALVGKLCSDLAQGPPVALTVGTVQRLGARQGVL